MARKPAKKPEAEAAEEVLFVCRIGNIWTPRGKLVKGGSMMLPEAEAAFLEAKMQEA